MNLLVECTAETFLGCPEYAGEPARVETIFVLQATDTKKHNSHSSLVSGTIGRAQKIF